MKYSFIIDENAVEHIDGVTPEFPYVAREWDLRDFIIPWHWHEEVEFNYVHKGAITIETTNQIFTMQQGDAYFINTFVMYKQRMADGASEAVEHTHTFHPLLLSGHHRSLFDTKYMDPILKNRSLEVLIIKSGTPRGKSFLALLHKLTDLSKEANSEFQIRNALSQAWLMLIEEIKAQGCRNSFQSSYAYERARNILSFIHQHYPEKITLSDISAHTSISIRECTRAFKETFHQAPMDYLIHYRVEQAKRLLKETDEPITNVAFLTGFHDSAYFSKTFKKYLNVTPKQFRQSCKTASRPATSPPPGSSFLVKSMV